MIVPTRSKGMQPVTLRVTSRADAERPVRHSHAEHGNDQAASFLVGLTFSESGDAVTRRMLMGKTDAATA
ncbi:hypothetical protein FPT12_11920 [Pseudomonas sp. H3(2019)]|nr:hypothetical protein FPT12_11920 [Pseudomonas sp. H3(2019)]